MKAIKIILGILLIFGALGNLRHVGGMRSAELSGYMAATMLFFVLGVYLLYSAFKRKPTSISISSEDDK